MYKHKKDDLFEAIGLEHKDLEKAMNTYGDIMLKPGPQSKAVEQLETNLTKKELAFILQEQTRKIENMARVLDKIGIDPTLGYADDDGCNCTNCRVKRIAQRKMQDSNKDFSQIIMGNPGQA